MKPFLPSFLMSSLFLLFSMFISCEKDSPGLPAHHGLLKRKLHYRTIKDTIPLYVSDYEYDSKNKLLKIQGQNYSELFKYNLQDELIARYGYRIDGSGSILNDSTSYTYQNGNLDLEELFYLAPIYSLSSYQTKFEYEHSKLKRIKEYRDHQFDRMTIYEYSGNLCIRENQYNDSIGSDMSRYWTHQYENDQLSITAQINTNGGIYNEMPLQVIYYLYDEKGNLISESAEQSMEISAWISYFNRYEYY